MCKASRLGAAPLPLQAELAEGLAKAVLGCSQAAYNGIALRRPSADGTARRPWNHRSSGSTVSGSSLRSKNCKLQAIQAPGCTDLLFPSPDLATPRGVRTVDRRTGADLDQLHHGCSCPRSRGPKSSQLLTLGFHRKLSLTSEFQFKKRHQ